MNENIIVRTREFTKFVSIDTVMYIENKDRKVVVHTFEEHYECYGKLKEMIGTLDDRIFQCHRSYAINVEKVSMMSNGNIIFKNTESIYLGRDKFRKTRAYILSYAEQNSKNSKKR